MNLNQRPLSGHGPVRSSRKRDGWPTLASVVCCQMKERCLTSIPQRVCHPPAAFCGGFHVDENAVYQD